MPSTEGILQQIYNLFMNGNAKTQITDGTNVIGTSAHPVVVSGSFTPIDISTLATSAKQDITNTNTALIGPLKADLTSATADTNTVTITQAGILGASLYNPSTTITMYVWFGAAPSVGAQIVLLPQMSKDVVFKTAQPNMQYKSSVAGGTLIYELDG